VDDSGGRQRQCEQVAQRERGDDVHDTDHAAPRRRSGGPPSASCRHQRGRDEQHEEEQQVVGALADVLDAQPGGGGEARQPRASRLLPGTG
jgi:hypothetical protein